MIDLNPIFLTLKLALVTTTILFFVSIPLANWLAFRKTKLKTFLEVLVSMPLVLPPSVLGFYLLLAFSPSNGIGKVLEEWFGLRLAFSFSGLVVASIIFGLPFMVHPIQSGLSELPSVLKDASYTLGKSKTETLIRVLLPNIKTSLITGIALTYAHTIGEFGVVLMIGGNIPDETRVASIAIYNEVETLHYHNANIYSLILFGLTFSILLLVYSLKHRFKLAN
ncbi:molybdate ABC transporter permease subunit [Leptospira perolatii]|uniref:Molybdenum transport system permease n=1 Tax=Leptospira perolatii TaxID=2023191 RepID=A0A2M9ZLS9_9LEPT|nr:molybdate ABC transporter permease subunit [Leptospira perolatii]PJZ69737.1 molybdate ABC transporter permease subunit [Leptospira perolatii]PJZ73048.1 molybdate ABC transporter permease subunit [Leptospira perolatii]